jgi:hypothetical protein
MMAWDLSNLMKHLIYHGNIKRKNICCIGI